VWTRPTTSASLHTSVSSQAIGGEEECVCVIIRKQTSSALGVVLGANNDNRFRGTCLAVNSDQRESVKTAQR